MPGDGPSSRSFPVLEEDIVTVTDSETESLTLSVSLCMSQCAVTA